MFYKFEIKIACFLSLVWLLAACVVYDRVGVPVTLALRSFPGTLVYNAAPCPY
jgi:hypothetical protein